MSADPATFLTGTGGYVRRRARVPRRAADVVLDASLVRALRAVDRLASARRDVLVASIYRDPERLTAALPKLRSERHRVRFALGAMGDAAPSLAELTAAEHLDGGKFPNLNVLVGAERPDWLVVVDDDVELPDRFLDRLLALSERFDLTLSQPAQTLASHAAWPHVRRRPWSLVRETRFVEIGPVTAFRREAVAALTPFPPLRWGWGLDLAWAAAARERGWRLGVVDAVPVRHEQGGVAGAYSSQAAIGEAAEFLGRVPHLTAVEAREQVAVHRRLR